MAGMEEAEQEEGEWEPSRLFLAQFSVYLK